jgi:carbon storage regulator
MRRPTGGDAIRPERIVPTQARRLSMLVLSRRPGERILIGSNIRITILRAAGGSVRIGIEAPDDVPILRDELQPYDELAGKSVSQCAGGRVGE